MVRSEAPIAVLQPNVADFGGHVVIDGLGSLLRGPPALREFGDFPLNGAVCSHSALGQIPPPPVE